MRGRKRLCKKITKRGMRAAFMFIEEHRMREFFSLNWMGVPTMANSRSLFNSAHPAAIAQNVPSAEDDLLNSAYQAAASLIRQSRPLQVTPDDPKDQQNAELVELWINKSDFGSFALDDSGDTYKVYDTLTGRDITDWFIKAITEPAKETDA